MIEKDSNNYKGDIEKNKIFKKNTTKKIATAAIFVGIGIALSNINPFAFIPIIGSKIFPFAHFINAITGVLIGLAFSTTTALGIAIVRYFTGLGTINAFHGHISGAIVVSIFAYLLWKYKPKHVDLAALTEPLGTIFIAGTIAQLITPVSGEAFFIGLFFFWGLFGASSVPGCILGYLTLKILRRAGISRKDYFE
ncbi:MAG: energy coupling factor transporter S component ThiW [Promethearchaeota archaeon]